MITQIDEQQATMIANTMHPARQFGVLANIMGGERCAGVRAIARNQIFGSAGHGILVGLSVNQSASQRPHGSACQGTANPARPSTSDPRKLSTANQGDPIPKYLRAMSSNHSSCVKRICRAPLHPILTACASCTPEIIASIPYVTRLSLVNGRYAFLSASTQISNSPSWPSKMIVSQRIEIPGA